ncbi:molybdenum-pterin binding domain-containing protein [Campylobacter blaseri]|uniref:Mop domain-containing protein n=1 Tax=Campylobacter blaseri TaxID=2042961 RepID=A0A2P8R1B4_9BACT|nr:TOBE domain-containing protein [Campylobacter blaseri]PSM52296.1 hypothetical protein CQ405_04385 [Campylobacter blaseri]PSM54062.1 hypothetical protein CRN67_04385 [Campylobacter blaseri]QKF85503.1 molybdenum-pterin binding domain-containing protein [Campylobacter blaseri]
MNRILAKVVKIQENGALHKVNFSSQIGNLSLVSLDLNLKIDQEVTLGFKSSAVAIGRLNDDMLSYSNQIKVKIRSIEKGQILTKVVASVNQEFITSIITTDSANRLNLKVEENAVFLIKATDVFVVSYD